MRTSFLLMVLPGAATPDATDPWQQADDASPAFAPDGRWEVTHR